MPSLQITPSQETTALRHYARQLEKENEALMSAFHRLTACCQAAIDCRDVVLMVGTVATVNRICDLLEKEMHHCTLMAMEPIVLCEPEAFIEEEYGVWCDACGAKLSEASEAAGCCLKCCTKN